MYRLVAQNYESEKLKESVEDIVNQTKLLSMATASLASCEPWINTVYFAYDEFLKFYIVTYENSRHMKNLNDNNQISLAVFDTNQNGQMKQGLQLSGMCKRVVESEQENALSIWSTRVLGGDKADDLLADYNTWDSKLYEIKIDYIKIFDELRFGQETWIECLVER